jgi:hypothetical protein
MYNVTDATNSTATDSTNNEDSGYGTLTTTLPTTQNDISQQLSLLSTTSSKVRYLDSKNYSRSQIAKILNIRYQHVRNVLITPLKK